MSSEDERDGEEAVALLAGDAAATLARSCEVVLRADRKEDIPMNATRHGMSGRQSTRQIPISGRDGLRRRGHGEDEERWQEAKGERIRR